MWSRTRISLFAIWTYLILESNSYQTDGQSRLDGPVRAASTATKLGPSFYVEPPSEVVFSNDTGGVIDCLAQGMPTPSVTWHTQQNFGAIWSPALEFSNDLWSIYQHNNSIRFRPFSPQEYKSEVHQATYICKAVSESGTIFSRHVKVKAVLRQSISVRVTPVLSSNVWPQSSLGNSLQLRCQIPKSPSQIFAVTGWFKNGQKLLSNFSPFNVEDSKKHFRLPNGDLIIFNLNPVDKQSLYTCSVTNLITQEQIYSQTFTLKLEDNLESRLQRPVMQDPGSTYIEVSLGETAILPCFSLGTPPPITSWFKESHHHLLNPLPSNPRYQEVNGALVISNINEEDRGNYRCVARNSAGEISSTLHLSIKHELEAFVSPEIQTVDVGQRAAFTCKLMPHNSAHLESGEESNFLESTQSTVSWLKDGEPAHSRPRIRIHGSRSEKLEVLSVFKEDAGIYQCFVSQGNNQYQTSGELRLGDAAPTFQYAFIDQTLQPGPFVSLKCSATGSPTPQIQWKLDGFPLPQNDRFMIGQYVSMHGDVISHLNISHTKVEDGGVYSCEAASRAGSHVHSARLNIYGPPLVRPFPDKIKAVEGRNFVLHCPVAGYPIQEVLWRKDGHVLQSDMRRKVFSNGTLHVVQVVKVHEEGQYSCEAKNRQGQSSKASTHLHVMVAPKIVPFSTVALLQRGERVTITCTMAKGDVPLNILWLKDGSPLTGEDDKVKILTFDHFNSMLTIESLELRHVGNYTCQAANPAGTASHSQAVHVNVPPSWLIKPSDLEAVLGHLVELPCSAEGSPKPSITWKKELGTSRGGDFLPIFGSQLNQGGLSTYPNGSLILSSIQTGQSGRYLCHVDNGIGQALHQIVNLTVKVPPRVISHKNSNIQRAAKGDKKTQLECQTEGDVPIKIKWTRDGDDVMQGSDRGRFSLETHIKNPATLNSGMASILSLTNVTKEDEAIYECIVTNPYGRGSHKIKLLVQEPPSPPQGLQVLEITSTSVRLNWQMQNQQQTGLTETSDTPRITKYIVELTEIHVPWDAEVDSSSEIKNFEPKISQIELPGHSNSALVGDLRPHLRYKARIYAENSLGRGEASAHITFSTLGDKPSAQPRRIEVSSPSSDSLIAHWEDPAKEHWNGELLGYVAGWRPIENEQSIPVVSDDLSHDQPLMYNWTEVERYDASDLRLWLRGLRPYVQYEILVQAFNQFGRGPMAKAKAYTLSDVPSVAPSNVECKALDSNSIQIRWSQLQPELLRGKLIAYKIVFQDVDQIGSDNGTHRGSAVTLPSHSLSSSAIFVLNDVIAFTNYSIMVNAETEQGEGPYSHPIFCLTEQSVPGPPGDVKVVSSSEHSVIVSWLPPEKPNGIISSYTLYKRYKSDSSTTYDNGIETEKSILSRNSDHSEVHGLRQGVFYQFFVSANGEKGEGNTSTVVGHRIPTFVANHQAENVQIFSIGHTVYAKESSEAKLACKFVVQGTGYASDARRNVETNWTRNGQETVLLSPSLLGRVSIQNDVLLIHRLRLSDSGNYCCKVRHKLNKQTDEVNYQLVVLGAPIKPKVALVSAQSHSLSLAIDTVASNLGHVEKPSPILWCTVSHKPLFGDTLETILPAKNMEHFLVRHLQCGKHYDISSVCVNAHGQSKPSDVLRDIRTLGQKPVIPQRPTDFVHPTNVSVRLDLFMWNDENCPVDYFVVSYKRSQDAHWTLVSNNLKMTSRRFTIKQLEPETSYDLRIRANNEAGSTEFKYSFETFSTMRAAGAHLADGHNRGQDLTGEDDSEGGQLQIVIPILLGALLVVILVGGVAVALRKRGNQNEPKPPEYSEHEPRMMKKEIIYSSPNDHGPIQFPNPLQYRDTNTIGQTPEYPEDIHPYATFVLPEAQCHSSVGTIGHQDMLILHETPTLPMSDKSSASNPYTMVHKPKRRRKRARGSISNSTHATSTTVGNPNAMSKPRTKQPQMGLSFRQHQMELMQHKTDNFYSQKIPNEYELNETSEDQEVSDDSSYSAEPEKLKGVSSRTESSNQLDHDTVGDQVWLPISKPVYKSGTLPHTAIDTDTLPSSEPDESSNFYYEDQEEEEEDTDKQSDCERIFIKQNNQFVGVKPYQVTVHAQSHLASPKPRRSSQKSSREFSEAECDREINNMPPTYLHDKHRRNKK